MQLYSASDHDKAIFHGAIYNVIVMASVPRLLMLTLKVPEKKRAEFANRVDLDEVAHNEPPHLDLHCLTSL